MKETNTNQFAQVVKSFERLNPGKGVAALFCYVELESNLDGTAFETWWLDNNF